MGEIVVMQRVAVLGSTGQLGTDLVEVLRRDERFDVIPLSHQEADCTKADEVQNVIAKLRPNFVINCAAFVRVDDCEDQASLAFEINALGAFNVARACAQADALCVYISTDYVFDGAKETPYVESDLQNPINVYGTSKLAGEHLVRQAAPRWLIVRVASLFGKTGARGKGGNFIETILAKAKRGEALRVVNDISISPTYARDAAEVLCHLLAKGVTGVVHAANGGSCTWYEFAKTALALCDLPPLIEPVATSAFPTRARRPRNSALASEKRFRYLNQVMPDWQAALRAYLIEKKHLSVARQRLEAAH
jgi:dTDP-4-dehydrorhamnose reductase